MMIIADENIDARLIFQLRQLGFDVYSIQESNSGISDNEVLQLANSKKVLLITEDADFGKLVNQEKLDHRGILFIRLSSLPRLERIEIAFNQIASNYEALKNKYHVLTPLGIRPSLV
jgi:predicted nuclease of predicted toxin-antitoxin system